MKIQLTDRVFLRIVGDRVHSDHLRIVLVPENDVLGRLTAEVLLERRERRQFIGHHGRLAAIEMARHCDVDILADLQQLYGRRCRRNAEDQQQQYDEERHLKRQVNERVSKHRLVNEIDDDDVDALSSFLSYVYVVYS